MQVFFRENKDRLTVYQMPAYSPDYNPIEILWKKIKGKGVHLKYFPTFESLTAKVDELLNEFQAKPSEVLKVFGFYTKKQKAG
jgi:transposase